MIHVSGRVQGVNYRASCRETAHSLSLTGTVENLLDGRVRIVTEGPADRIEALVAWCRKGPAFAAVEAVEAKYGDATGSFESFRVKR